MKKTYETIDMTVVPVDEEDVITTSLETEPVETEASEHDNGYIDFGDFL